MKISRKLKRNPVPTGKSPSRKGGLETRREEVGFGVWSGSYSWDYGKAFSGVGAMIPAKLAFEPPPAETNVADGRDGEEKEREIRRGMLWLIRQHLLTQRGHQKAISAVLGLFKKILQSIS